MAIASAQRTATIEEQYHRKFQASHALSERAAQYFPLGVTHVARTTSPFPVYIERAQGSRKWDIEGHEFVDYWVGHGSLLLGHSHPAVVEAVQRQAALATHPGASHELEVRWAELVCSLIPSAEMVRFVSSGTEATMMALRLCRMFTGKRKLLKFLGHFHGWSDNLILDSQPPYGQGEPGVLREVMDTVIAIPPNDVDALKGALENEDLACCIIEPTGNHFGQIPIRGKFLRTLRELTRRAGVPLIFDEVISGFRVHPGGAQGLYGIRPDLTTLAKILAGGLPGGAVVGRADIIDLLAYGKPGKRYRHPGTFNANPLSAAAGIAALQVVSDGEPCRRANALGALLRRELNRVLQEESVNWCVYGDFSAIKILPDYSGPAPEGDDFLPYGGDMHRLEAIGAPARANAFRLAMMLNGVDVQPLRGMTCAAHTEEDIEITVHAFERTIEMLKEERLV